MDSHTFMPELRDLLSRYPELVEASEKVAAHLSMEAFEVEAVFEVLRDEDGVVLS